MTLHTLAVGGDSQTDVQAGWGVEAWNVWGVRLAEALSLGSQDRYQARIFGLSGDTSAQLLARAGNMLYYDIPEIAAVAIGINDTNAAIDAAGTTLNNRAIIMGLKHGARGVHRALAISVTSADSLPATANPGDRLVVVTDSSTTGGAAARRGQAARIGGSVTGPTVWECRYPLSGEAGWGRVATSATTPTAVTKIMVVGAPYTNWTAGGDTPSTPNAARKLVRDAQAAAVAAENVNIGGQPTVILADVYAFMRQRIVDGKDPDFSVTAYNQARSWHAQVNNQHYSAYGHALTAEACDLAARSAWPALFTA
jgi:hypothetical protein